MARISTRVGAIAAVSAAFALVSVPAFAAKDDIWGTKSHVDNGPVANGEAVDFTVDLWNPSGNNQNNLDVWDTLDEGLVYVPESTLVEAEIYQFGAAAFDELPLVGGTRTDYDFDNNDYWVGSWIEVNDGASDSESGFVRRAGFGANLDAIGLTGLAAAPTLALDNPGITRTIEPAKLVGLVDAHMTFDTDDQNLDDGDTLGVWVSTDGGTTWSAPATFPKADGSAARGMSLEDFLPATSLMLRFGVASGDYSSDATWDDTDELWALDYVSIEAVYENHYTYDNVPGGVYDDLLNGAANALILPADGLDLPAQLTLHSIDHISNYKITYSATVDTSATIAWAKELSNLVMWRSDSYVLDPFEFNSDQDYVQVEYAPAVDLVVTSNSPVSTGQPIVVAFVFNHGAASDGSPVCVPNDGIDFPDGSTFGTWDPTGGDDDMCLEQGETWTFTLTYPPHGTAGVVNFAAAMEGMSRNSVEGDRDVSVNASTDVTVVLAATGASSGWLAGVSAALVALGATALVVARRRTA